MSTPQSLSPGQMIARGVCRFLVDQGAAPVTEFAPGGGLRMDVAALTDKGRIICVECKSGAADFQSDKKWRGYLDWCDEFYFAVDADFPVDLLPEDQGLIIADGFGAEIIRPSTTAALAGARRKAQVLRIGRIAALRLRSVSDPGLSRFLDAGSGGEDQPRGETG